MDTRAKDITKKRMILFSAIVFGILYIPWIIGIMIPDLGETVYAVIAFRPYLWEPLLWLFLSHGN